jgi:hypothetical protein
MKGYETAGDFSKLVSEAIFIDDFGRKVLRTSTITEESVALLQHRVLLCQSDEELLDDGAYIELVVQSTNAAPVVFISLGITAQMSTAKLELFEGGTATGGAMPTCIQPNRIPPIPTPNSSTLKGTPLAPVGGDEGTAITGPNGFKLIGLNAAGAADWISTTIDIGGFICMPLTWYRLRVTNTSGRNNRDIQLSLKYIDASNVT